MATQKETVEYIMAILGQPTRFTVRAMFGEYALYVDKKVVALICDDQLYVKILPASQALADICEQDTPYPGAKPHYLVEESQLAKLDDLPDILIKMSKSLPLPKKKVKKSA